MTITARDANTSTSQGSAPLVIVSCDTHIGPRLARTSGSTARGSARGLRRLRRRAGGEARSGGGRAREACRSVAPAWATTGACVSTTSRRRVISTCTLGSSDLDSDGVAAEVMFHDSQNGEPVPFQNDTLLMRGPRTSPRTSTY